MLPNFKIGKNLVSSLGCPETGQKVWFQVWLPGFKMVHKLEISSLGSPDLKPGRFQVWAQHIYCSVMISIKWSETAPKNALASMDIIVTQLLCYHMSLLYFVCNHLILYFRILVFFLQLYIESDKVWVYEEMMTKDDNVESNPLTSSLLKIRSLYKFCYKLHMSSWRSRWTELYSSYIYEVCCTSDEVCWGFTSICTTRVYHSIHGSTMDSL